VREEAARVLWERYRPLLLQIVRRRFDSGVVEEAEGVALDAFYSFYSRQQLGTLTVEDRADLEKVLRVIIGRKICNALEWQHAQRRDPRHEGPPANAGLPPTGSILDLFTASPSEEELAAAMNEALEPIHRALSDVPELQEIVRWILEDYTPGEIAKKLRCSSRTVERRYERIRGRLEPLRREWEGRSHE
jgi:RNA polymerase sigma factor (sigma-70 family)